MIDMPPIFSFNFLNINRKLGASTPSRLLHEPVLPNDLTVRRVRFLLRFSFAAFRSTLMYSCQHSISISLRFPPPGSEGRKTNEGEGGYIPLCSVGLVAGADESLPSDGALAAGNDQLDPRIFIARNEYHSLPYNSELFPLQDSRPPKLFP